MNNDNIGYSLIYGRQLCLNPFLSVCIPTYRRLGFLRKAIKSVLSQQFPVSYEIIISDNDQSKDILDIANQLPSEKITIYQNDYNIGLFGNMQHLLNISSGKWILFLCDDDQLLPNAIKSFYQKISNNVDKNIGCLTGGAEICIDLDAVQTLSNKNFLVKYPVDPVLYPNKSVLRIEDNMSLVDVPKLCSSFFLKNYIKSLGGWDAKCCGYADLALYLKIQSQKKLFSCTDIFGKFYVHSSNESHNQNLLSTYPVHSAQRLLSNYVDEKYLLGKSIRNMLEKQYVDFLWKNKVPAKKTKIISRLLLDSFVEQPSLSFLLRNPWLLLTKRLIYFIVRPALALSFKSLRKINLLK